MEKLDEYRRKRNLKRSAEPGGEDGARAGAADPVFVIHKHDASQLHFDLRLEQQGVLRSWAVPKGPTLKVGDKHLAVAVEDHPYEYKDFEGTIPKHEYGGGTVMIWDRGHWRVSGKHTTGHLDFELDGDKLTGAWTLVRMSGKAGDGGKNWLLIKRHDRHGRLKTKAPGDRDTSAASGRTMAEIARAADHRKTAGVAGITLTHPDRVLYDEMNVTKRDVARYYQTVGDWMLPYIANRPLSLLRCPGGSAQCFFQKHPRESIPDSVGRTLIAERNGDKRRYTYVRSAADLVALVQAGTLELHPWGSRVDKVEKPDTLVFDLDPSPEIDWREVLRVARALRERIERLGLVPFARLTGGKGLHLVVPIARRSSWDEARAFSQALCQRHAGDEPKRLTATMSKAKRRGRIFLDYLRNGRGATAIANYSTRARPKAPIATPLRWDELTPTLTPDHYRIDNLPQRLASLRDDPWDGFESARRPLNKAMRKGVGLHA